MVGLPNAGARVHVWPAPGLRVQDGQVSVADGGRFLKPEGREVVWSEWHYGQLRAGEIYLHDPRPAPEPAPAPPKKAKE